MGGALVDSAESRGAAHSGSTARLLLLGLNAGALHYLVWRLQNRIADNGVDWLIAGVRVVGTPRDGRGLLADVAAYVAVTALSFAVYAAVLHLARSGHLSGARETAIALLFPVLFHVGLVPVQPSFSIDLTGYIAHGRIGSRPGGNPYVTAVRELDPQTMRELAPLRFRPVHRSSAYGPLWTRVEVGVVRLTRSIPAAMLAFKGLAALASLACAALVWSILGRVDPARQLLGTLVWLWNPLVVVEFAGEGHNDALMLAFALLGVRLALSGWTAAAIAGLAAGVWTKYLPVLLLPATLAYAWSARRSTRDFARAVLLGGLASVALAVVCYRPYWVGWATIAEIASHGELGFAPAGSLPIAALLASLLSDATALRIASLAAGAVFIGLLVGASLAARDASRYRMALARIALAWVLLAGTRYWPWYSSLPLALIAVAPLGALPATAIALGLGARLSAPLDAMMVTGFVTWPVQVWTTTAVGCVLPAAAWLLLEARERRRSGTPPARG